MKQDSSALRTSAEFEAIARVVGQMVATWNRHNMKGYARLFSASAAFVNIGGGYMNGRDEIERQHERIHAGHYRDSELRAELRDVRFIRPDVAIAHVACAVTYGTSSEFRDTLMTLVLANDGQQWLIAAAHNTLAAGSPVEQPAPPRS